MNCARAATVCLLCVVGVVCVVGGGALADDPGWRKPATQSSSTAPAEPNSAPAHADAASWRPVRTAPSTPTAATTPSLVHPTPSGPPRIPSASPFRPASPTNPTTRPVEPPATGLYLKPKPPRDPNQTYIDVPVGTRTAQVAGKTSSTSNADRPPEVLPPTHEPARGIINISPNWPNTGHAEPSAVRNLNLQEPAPEQLSNTAIRKVVSPPVLASPSGGERPARLPQLPGESEAAKGQSPPKDQAEILPPPRPLSEDLGPPRKLPGSTTPPPSSNAPEQSQVQTLGGPVLEPHPYLEAGVVGVPSRGRVFGSPAITLSRDGTCRDTVGIDLMTESDRDRLIRNAEDDGPPSDRTFVQAEYLLWWANPANIPVLAATGPASSGGVLGNDGARSLLGPGTFGPSLRDGFRVRAGTYFNECSGRGIDGSFFVLGRRGETFTTETGQNPVISRPFFAQNTGTEFAEIVSFPNLSRGTLEIVTDSVLWGADANLRCANCRSCLGSHGWLAGYRHVNLTENLNIAEFITSAGPLSPDPVGTRLVVRDRFRTQNQFHGGQLGGFWNRRYGRIDVDARGTLAMGVTHQIITIDGSQERIRPGEGAQVFRGGLLATGPNIGTFTANRFSVVPEATFNFGYLITPGVRTYIGYNFLYWSNVVRPGDQIDRVIDVTLIPNPPAGVAPAGRDRPTVPFRQSDFWAQGMQFGVELRW